jgi:hypothetical protein
VAQQMREEDNNRRGQEVEIKEEEGRRRGE